MGPGNYCKCDRFWIRAPSVLSKAHPFVTRRKGTPHLVMTKGTPFCHKRKAHLSVRTGKSTLSGYDERHTLLSKQDRARPLFVTKGTPFCQTGQAHPFVRTGQSTPFCQNRTEHPLWTTGELGGASRAVSRALDPGLRN